MRIEVLAVDGDGDDMRVTFRTSIGIGIGRWRGRGAPTRATYDVEYYFGDETTPAVTVVDGEPAMSHDGEHTTVRAIAEVDPDGFVCCRLAKSGFVLFGEVPGVVEGQTIEMRMPWRELTLWPTGIDAPLR
jgi:hypothetical protein